MRCKMCHINFYLSKKGKRSSKIKELINMVSYGSYLKNSDGDGFLTDTEGIIKGEDKQLITKNFLWALTHQRISTSGKTKENTQPLESKDFIIAHNGVFTKLGDAVKSDTHEFLDILQKEYMKERDVVKCLVKILSEQVGWYSVFLYDKHRKKMYYFKDSRSTFYFIEDDRHFFGSTSKENCSFISEQLKIAGKIEEVIQEKIYSVFDDWEVLSTFTEKEEKCYFTSGYNGYYNHRDGYYRDIDKPIKPSKNRLQELRKIIEEEKIVLISTGYDGLEYCVTSEDKEDLRWLCATYLKPDEYRVKEKGDLIKVFIKSEAVDDLLESLD